LMGAPSMGQFYNQNIKGSGSDGPYDCRTHRIPGYKESSLRIERSRYNA
jgi:hypothetical protein